MLADALQLLVEGKALAPHQFRCAFEDILLGSESALRIAAFLAVLRTKGETAEELYEAASVLREHMIPLCPPHRPDRKSVV